MKKAKRLDEKTELTKDQIKRTEPPGEEGPQIGSAGQVTPMQVEPGARIPTEVVPSIEQGPLVGVEGPDAPPTEERQTVLRRYEELDEGVRNVTLSDNKNYFVIRNSMGLPEPDMLVWKECYIPLGPIKNDSRFALRRPTDRKTGKPLVETHVPEFQYHIGKDIGMDEVLRLKTLYTEVTAEGGRGRPSNNEELIKFRAKFGGGARTQVLAITGGKRSIGDHPALGDNEQFDSKKEVHRAAPSPPAREAHGMDEVKQTQAGTIFYKDDRYPLAAFLMTQLAGETIAAKEISTVAIALVLSSTKDVDNELFTLLQNAATHPHEFADLVTIRLKEMYRSMNPTVLAELDVADMNLENWRQYAIGQEFEADQQIKAQLKTIEGLVERIDIAERMMPEYLRGQYQTAMTLVEANHLEAAEMQVIRATAANQAVATAAASTMGRNDRQAAGTPGPRKDPFEKIYKLRELEEKLEKAFGRGTRLPMDSGTRNFADTGQVTPEVKKKFYALMQEHPEFAKSADKLMRNLQGQRQGGNPAGES